MKARVSVIAATVAAVGIAGFSAPPAQAAGKYSVACTVGGDTVVSKPGSMTWADYSWKVNGSWTSYRGWTNDMTVPTPAGATKVIVLLSTQFGTAQWNMGVGCR